MYSVSAYDDKLIRRGTITIDMDLLEKNKTQLSAMNKGKEGSPFQYGDCIIDILAIIHAYFGLPYRQTQGLATSLFGDIKVPHYTTICRRVNSLDISHTTRSHNDAIILVDSSGIKVTNRGDWMRHKHGHAPRRGFHKLHIAVNEETNEIVAYDVTDESVHDSQKMHGLIQQALANGSIKQVKGDGAYDTAAIFDDLYNQWIMAVIPVRRNSRFDTSSYPRRMAVKAQLPDVPSWKKRTGYGRRWIVESAFSTFKRMFGEFVMARKKENMVHEIGLKVMLYNRMVWAQ